MLVTPDGHSRLELSRFLTPPPVADHRDPPVNSLGYLRVMFTVDDVDETLARLRNVARSSIGDVVAEPLLRSVRHARRLLPLTLNGMVRRLLPRIPPPNAL